MDDENIRTDGNSDFAVFSVNKIEIKYEKSSLWVKKMKIHFKLRGSNDKYNGSRNISLSQKLYMIKIFEVLKQKYLLDFE